MLRSRSAAGGGGVRRTALFFPALVLVCGISPLATDTYIAALPHLQASLHTSAVVAQLTLTAFIVGVATGQLVIGPLSDAHGRRRLLLIGAAVFTVTSAVCAVAPNGPVLVVVRLLQGLSAGCGIAVGRAVVGDAYDDRTAARQYGTLAAITFLGPVIAPALGGAVLVVGSWRTVFGLLTVLGLIMLAVVAAAVPETLPLIDRHGSSLRETADRMAALLRHRPFVRHVGLQCVSSAGFFVYIGGSAFVLETVYGISATRYATIFATNAAAMAVSSLLFRLLVTRAGPARLRTVGLWLAATAALGLLACALAGRSSPVPLALPWVLLCATTCANGLLIPASQALAQQAGRQARGTASALQGGLSFLAGALATPLTGWVGYHSWLPMALLMAGFCGCAAALDLAFRRSGRPAVLPVAAQQDDKT